MLQKLLQLVRHFLAGYVERIQLITSNFCLGVSVSLFFSLFINSNTEFYVDTWCGKLVPLDYSMDDNFGLRSVTAAILFILSIIARKNDRE